MYILDCRQTVSAQITHPLQKLIQCRGALDISTPILYNRTSSPVSFIIDKRE